MPPRSEVSRPHEKLEQRGRARQAKVAATKAAGGRPRSGESMSILDEIAGVEEDAYQKGAKDGRAQRPTKRPGKGPRVDAPPAAAPASSGGGGLPSFGAAIPRQTSSRIILVSIVLAGIGTIARDVIHGSPASPATIKTPDGGTVTTPTHLHSLAGVAIAGTIALVVNEFSPQAGMALGVLLLVDVSIGLLGPQRDSSGKVTPGLIDSLAGGIIRSGPPGSATPINNPNFAPGGGTPGSSSSSRGGPGSAIAPGGKVNY